MPDPLSLIAAGAAIGGAAGKFVEKAWDSGDKWISSYFENHQEQAKQRAAANSLEFLNDLATRIKTLEETSQVSKERIIESQEQPDFSVILQKALLSAAQTESKDKHQLLSRLVSERIKSKPESLMALASKMAVDAISYTTSNQLRILGLVSNILYISPDQNLSEQQYIGWLNARLGAFIGTEASNLDYIHLESLSCLKFESFITRDLNQSLSEKVKAEFNYEIFKATPLGVYLADVWENKNLKSTQLTSVGQIIGVLVSDQLTNSTTNMQGWECAN